MATLEDLRRITVRPNPPLGPEEDNNFQRGADAMRAAIIIALTRNGPLKLNGVVQNLDQSGED